MTDIPRISPMASEFSRVGEAVTQAMSDSMVERMTITAANALEVVDRLNDPDIKEGVSTLLEAIGTMQRTGVLQTAIDTVHMIHALRSTLSDSMVDRAFSFIEHMANNLGTEDLATIAHEAKGAMEDALDQCAIPGSGGGLFGTMRMMAKPETQEALRFMLAFSCSLRKRVQVIAKTTPPL
ncbi:MAG: DUF1641 domain-containing protein [Magnetospirillum sp.]|nr:DUF1641 domain-containing protein [Magnetospirillum sp.]